MTRLLPEHAEEAAAPQPRHAVLGVPVWTRGQLELEKLLLSSRDFVELHGVNAEISVQVLTDAEHYDLLSSNPTNLIDGQGVRKVLNLKYGERFECISGSDFVIDLCRISAEQGWRVFLMGGTEAANAGACAALRKRFPTLQAARLSPPFDRNPDGSPAPRVSPSTSSLMLEEIATFRPHVVIGCLGAPKQELWFKENRETLRDLGVRVWMGAGGTFDFLAGVVRRAPSWISRGGFEWLWRLANEPRGRLKRVAGSLPRFALLGLAEALLYRCTGTRAPTRSAPAEPLPPNASLPTAAEHERMPRAVALPTEPHWLRDDRDRSGSLYARAGSRLSSGVFLLVGAPFALLVGGLIAAGNCLVFGDLRKILFFQTRVGRDGVPFQLVKFRTMRSARSHFDSWSSDQDRLRVTSFGRFLRNSHLDELPQLWNVLTGDMDLIGPRPEMVEVHAWASASVPGFERRLLVRPGITGLAQITQGYTGHCPIAYAEKLRIDERYIRGKRLGVDLRIAWMTVGWMFRGRGWAWKRGRDAADDPRHKRQEQRPETDAERPTEPSGAADRLAG